MAFIILLRIVARDWSFRISGKNTVILDASTNELVMPLSRDGLSWIPIISTKQFIISLLLRLGYNKEKFIKNLKKSTK